MQSTAYLRSWTVSRALLLSELKLVFCILRLRPQPLDRLRTSFTHDNTNVILHIGVKSYEVSLESQTATVVAEPTLSYEKVLQTITKTGKKVNEGEADGEKRSVEVPAVEAAA